MWCGKKQASTSGRLVQNSITFSKQYPGRRHTIAEPINHLQINGGARRQAEGVSAFKGWR